MPPRRGRRLRGQEPVEDCSLMPPRRSRRLRGQEPVEDCSRSSGREVKQHEAKPASAQTQAEALAQVSQLSGRCITSPPVPCIWEQLWRDWGRRFYIRLDAQGCYHTYPDLGGPFKSLLETDKAIDCYLEARRDPKMCVEQDKAIRQSLYWPDGTVMRSTMSEKTEKYEMCQMVQALVDKYNEENNLLEDRAHELKDALHYQAIFENLNLYYHLNFTTNIKGAGPNECSEDNLFFLEVKFIPQGKLVELQANSFCAINPDDNGRCYGCTRVGNVGMKHPSSAVGYTAGHLNVGLPLGYFTKWKKDYEDEEDDDKYVKAREADLRQMYKGLNPDVRKQLCTPPPWATKRKAPE